MITSDRLQFLLRQLQADDDEILGDKKQMVKDALTYAITKYKHREMEQRYKGLRPKIMRILSVNCEDKIKEEACDILCYLIDRDCQSNNIKLEWIGELNEKYCMTLLDVFEETDHNREVVAHAFRPGKVLLNKIPLKNKDNIHNFDDDFDDYEYDDLMEDD